ncbi:lytic transglycosylase domain-containing protein [Rudanella lutea]|uniref:lytic transglycosylase domain-containing protein n=1 Tax=Rudanella lutea TaxID=451374 RepID=UPI0003790229|nr:lytic transglycosylase domain-containing protein [Rudanella lutea]
MIKEISISLLLATGKSVAGAVPAKLAATLFDTSRTTFSGRNLDNPTLLSVDSANRVFPVYFCGEEVPVGQPGVWRRWIQTLRGFSSKDDCLYDVRQRATSFFPIIDPILRKYRIPRDFRYLPLAESELVNDCVSPRGASGYWQLMPETARELGLRVDGNVDERYDLRKATVAVCHYLHQLYRQLGSWSLVAAAYNGGLGHVQSRMQQQRQKNYFKLSLHRETSHYLFRILAYKELISNPKQYELLLSKSAVARLTKPLPRFIKPVPLNMVRNGNELIPTEPEPLESDMDSGAPVNPTWGPRPDKSLESPSEFERILAQALYPEANTDLQGHQAHFPVTRLLAIMAIRFRRPRYLQYQEGEGLRPVHEMEWI